MALTSFLNAATCQEPSISVTGCSLRTWAHTQNAPQLDSMASPIATRQSMSPASLVQVLCSDTSPKRKFQKKSLDAYDNMRARADNERGVSVNSIQFSARSMTPFGSFPHD